MLQKPSAKSGRHHPNTELIRSLLADRGWTVTALAKETGCAYQYVCEAISGRVLWRGAQIRIAEALGVPIWQVFPWLPAAGCQEARRVAQTEAIRKVLTARGWKVKDLAEETGMERQYVSGVIHGRLLWQGAQRRVAKALGVPIEQVFPGRNGTDGC